MVFCKPLRNQGLFSRVPTSSANRGPLGPDVATGVNCRLFAISMLQASQRTVLQGPAFIRLLARLIRAHLPPPEASLSDRLSQWLDWKHALALSTALDGGAAAQVGDDSSVQGVSQVECTRIRAAQVEAIAADAALHGVGKSRGRMPADQENESETIDYVVFRQRYLARQRSMQSVTGDLRGRLRDRLAAQSAQMARLAEVDAVMELALSPREQALLANVPVVLEAHFANLRQLAVADASKTAGTWLDVFRKDMQSVLLAELDIRFQPVDGLLAALRTC